MAPPLKIVPVADAPPSSPRSAEREALAAAIQRRNDAVAALGRIHEAQRRAPELYLLSQKVDALATALAETRAAEPARLVEVLMGTGAEGPSPIRAAEAALDAAEAELENGRQVHALLVARDREAISELGYAESYVRQAVTEVLRADHAVAACLARYDEAFHALAEACRVIQTFPAEAYKTLRPYGVVYYGLDLPDRGTAAPWRAALAALADDPDAQLPAV